MSALHPTLTLEPIGYLWSGFGSKVEAPRQPAASREVTGVIELLPGRNFEHALDDLAGWGRIWVIFWFHHNHGWRPKVLPPRSESGRKGVFATRAPHRPNPLGLSALELLKVAGLSVHVRGVDLLDGTPVLDIKPYVPYTDAFPEARSGWLQAAQDPLPDWVVRFEPLAEAQLQWIEQRSGQLMDGGPAGGGMADGAQDGGRARQEGFDLRGRIAATLQLGPQPHPYRRIKPLGNGLQLAVKDWRIDFTVVEREVAVRRVRSGYRQSQLDSGRAEPALALHREFAALWPAP